MKNCPFCYDNIKDCVVAEQNSVITIQDDYPVTAGHLLIVPKRHMEDYFSMNEADDMFLRCCDISNAKALISGDSHLLALKF